MTDYVKLFRPATGDTFKALRTDSAGIADLLREGWEIAAAPVQSAEPVMALCELDKGLLRTAIDCAQHEGHLNEESTTRLRELVLSAPQPSPTAVEAGEGETS